MLDLDKEIYTTKEAAKILKIGAPAVRDAIKSGKLPAFKISTSWIIRREDLQRYIERKTKK